MTTCPTCRQAMPVETTGEKLARERIVEINDYIKIYGAPDIEIQPRAKGGVGLTVVAAAVNLRRNFASAIDAAIADAKAEERAACAKLAYEFSHAPHGASLREAIGSAILSRPSVNEGRAAKSPEPSAPTTGDYGEGVAEVTVRSLNAFHLCFDKGHKPERRALVVFPSGELEKRQAWFRAFVRDIANAGLAEGEKRGMEKAAKIAADYGHGIYRDAVQGLDLRGLRDKELLSQGAVLAANKIAEVAKGASDAATR